ncbi:MAG: glycosyltransferase family 61 protein [Rhodomicrobium sp.]
MVSLHYKGRIYKAKFTMRSIRYILSDQAARAIPALQRRWLLPLESQPIGEAASEDLAIPTAAVDLPLPESMTALGISHPQPLQLTDHIYSFDGTVVTGWAGAMIKDGVFLAMRPQPNWVSTIRAHPYRLRALPGSRRYFNLMVPIPARGHIFHWLFDSIVPLLTYLESGGRGHGLGLIVNASRSPFQQITLDYLKARYGIEALEPLGKYEAVYVPHLMAAIPVPYGPRALQSPVGMAVLDDLGRFIAGEDAGDGLPKRIYISRNDARLRRVRNEDSLLPILEARGIHRVTLKGLPLARQVQLFRQAEAVVAPHGAGLAHSAWCKPGTKIIEFFPSPYGPYGKVKNATANMWLIAMQRALDYSCYLAGPPETRSDGFTIPEDLLLQTLQDASIVSA